MLGVVTATVNRERAEPCFASWVEHAAGSFAVVVVENGGPEPYLGPVAAFRVGVEQLLKQHPACEVIACFHDDLVIFDYDWDREVLACFERRPTVGLAGFAGSGALGTEALYQAPYDAEQLARRGYRSNASDAEAFGARQLEPGPIVCPAAFSLIARRCFWNGFTEPEWRTKQSRRKVYPRPWAVVDDLGIVDHFYDGALACLARRGGWGVWYLPVRCRHLRGQTTDTDPGYRHWADEEIDGGDRGFWEAAHRIGYETFRDVLPLRLAD